MRLAIQQDLDALRGFGPTWSEQSAPPAGVTPLQRLLPEYQPMSAADERVLLRDLVRLEAGLFALVLATDVGEEQWEEWRQSLDAQRFKYKPEASAKTILASIRCSPDHMAVRLREIGILRVHRANFLRHVRSEQDGIRDKFSNGFEKLRAFRRELMVRNLRMVRWRIPWGLSRVEGMVLGAIGLLDAVDRFDIEKGRLVTYARHWIKARHSRASSLWTSALRDPGILLEHRMRARRWTRETLFQRNPLTVEAAVEASGVSEPRRLLHVYRSTGEGWRARTTSSAWGSRILDVRATHPGVDDRRVGKLISAWSSIEEALEDLKPRQQRILLQRFGLMTGKRRTLSAIGKDLDLSRERVRQLENLALEAIREKVLEKNDDSAWTSDQSFADIRLPPPPGLIEKMVQVLELNTLADAMNVKSVDLLQIQGVGDRKVAEYHRWVASLSARVGQR